MAEFPYAAVPRKLSKLLEKIQTVGMPVKADTTWLKTHGFKSSNDPSALRVLEFIGFIDSTKHPTDRWQNYRHKGKSKSVLGAAIKQGYSALYEDFPEAHQSDDDDLENFFSVRSKAGKQAISRTVKTFQTLCSMADFDTVDHFGDAPYSDEVETLSPNGEKVASEPDRSELAAPALHLDVQVHISADASESQIDKIFESMARHLYGGKGVEQPQ